MRDILLGTNLFEVVFRIYHFIEELFNLHHYWWRSCDVAALFILRQQVHGTSFIPASSQRCHQL